MTRRTATHGYRDPPALRRASRISYQATLGYGVFANVCVLGEMVGFKTMVGFDLSILYAILFAGFGMVTRSAARIMEAKGMPPLASAAASVALAFFGCMALAAAGIMIVRFHAIVAMFLLA